MPKLSKTEQAIADREKASRQRAKDAVAAKKAAIRQATIEAKEIATAASEEQAPT